MSTHFTYEIDERNLRVKLKDLEAPVNEDAWKKFESYVSSQTRQNHGNPLKGMQMPINRNVIIPVVFGILIIFFSILLFNFITIKNPSVGANQSAAPQEITIPSLPASQAATQQAQPGPSPNLSMSNLQPDPIPTPDNNKPAAIAADSNALKTPTVINHASLQNTVQVAAKPVQVQAAAPTATVSQQVVPSSTVTAASAADAKKRKRRTVDVVETDSSNDSRPSPGAEREDAARPN